MIKKFQKPWLENPRIFSLSALGKEHDTLLKTLHGFTEDVSRGYKVKIYTFNVISIQNLRSYERDGKASTMYTITMKKTNLLESVSRIH